MQPDTTRNLKRAALMARIAGSVTLLVGVFALATAYLKSAPKLYVTGSLCLIFGVANFIMAKIDREFLK